MGLIKDLLVPQIYLLKDKGQFLYTRGKLRIVFDHLELFENMGAYTEINTLYLLRPREVSEESYDSYIVFDLNGAAIAVTPYSSKTFFYGSGGIYLYRSNEAEGMAMSRFIKEQHEILATSTIRGDK